MPDHRGRTFAAKANCFNAGFGQLKELDFDLVAAAQAKIDKNEERYPADKVRGQAKKYSEY